MVCRAPFQQPEFQRLKRGAGICFGNLTRQKDIIHLSYVHLSNSGLLWYTVIINVKHRELVGREPYKSRN